MYRISKRGIVRWITIPLAVIITLAALLMINYNAATKAKQQLEYGYLRAVQDLSASLEEIKTTLNKGMYTTSPVTMNDLSGRLWNASSAAKVSMSQLPISDFNLSSTYKFLSQVGDYSKAIAKKFGDGEPISDEDKDNILKLYDFAESVSNQMWAVENQIQGGYLTFEKVVEIADNSAQSDINPGSITDGFKDVEEGFDGFPTLIYDGPFSDHIMQKSSEMLKNLENVDETKAHDTAYKASGISGLTLTTEESGKMPSYVFKDGSATVGVTKAGGLLSYILNYRLIEDEKVTVEQCVKLAKKFLSDLGITEVTNTYYETSYGMCIINFAAVENDVVMYTDLIKVGVAMDNGEILTYDARGYINNHIERHPAEPAIKRDEALRSVSENLKAEKSQLAIIPSSGLNEKYCYEFKCRTDSGQQVLVYINANTGKEEQILLLQINEFGMLTV